MDPVIRRGDELKKESNEIKKTQEKYNNLRRNRDKKVKSYS